MPVFEPVAKLLKEPWSKGLQVLIELYNGRCKVLNAIGGSSFYFVRKYFVKFVTRKYACTEHLRNMGLLHPQHPFRLDFFVDSKRDVV